MGKGLVGLFVGVFVGAVAYELLKKTEITQTAVRKISDGMKSARLAFKEGYQVAAAPTSETA